MDALLCPAGGPECLPLPNALTITEECGLLQWSMREMSELGGGRGEGEGERVGHCQIGSMESFVS